MGDRDVRDLLSRRGKVALWRALEAKDEKRIDDISLPLSSPSRAALTRSSRFQKLDQILKSCGYSDADIDGIFHGNWLRFFGESLPQS